MPVVAIGASAGGLDALLRLFKALPEDLCLTFIVIQHLDPSHPSQTGSILSRYIRMPVEDLPDGKSIEPGRVYIAPSHSYVTVESGTFRLVKRDPNHKADSVDKCFESIAKDKKAEAIGVVLSGTGSDGTAGVMAIKSEGGIVFAQDPDSAKHDGMPRSAIKSGAADYVLSPEGIAEELIKLSRRVKSGEVLGAVKSSAELIEESDEVQQRIFHLLLAHSQIDFSVYKQSTVGRRIQRQMRVHKQEDVKSYLDFLQKNPSAVKELSEEMFIHVTEFFRDPESFDALSTTVFPRLLKDRIAGAPLRIWVPGCSTGEEPYSIAISLLEFLGAKAATIPIQIFATDISEDAVQRARTGLYKESEVEGVSSERLKRFFDKTKEGYRVKKSLRDLCTFSRHDVANSPPFARIDLLSCRNLLIYFAPDLQKQVMPIFHYSLNREGFLWLGKSEAPIGFSKLFTLIDKTHKIYAKVNLPTPLNFKFPTPRRFVENTGPVKSAASRFAINVDAQTQFDRIVMARYAPAGVMINSHFEIIQVRGHTGPFMELPSGEPTHNLFKMVRQELLPAVRMALQSAIREQKPARKDGIAFEYGAEFKKVNIEVVPVNLQASEEERQYLVFFEKGDESKPNVRLALKELPKAKASKKKLDSKEAYIRQLLDEIDSMREYQQALAEGYEAGQEELTAANEELQSANEELQSTNEEMETAKEELQAANEELTTVNEELQTRNSELASLNEQLAFSEERFRLLVTSVKDYAIFLLDPEGRVATWNEGARRFKGYEASEIIGKHFSIFYPKSALDTGYPDMELRVAAKEGRYEDEGWRVRKNGSKFWANVIITRINDANGKLVGFSKVTRDLTERKKMEDELRNSRDELEVRVKERTAELEKTNIALEAERQKLNSLLTQAPAPIAVFEGPDLVYRFANEPYLAMVARRGIIGKRFDEVFPELRGTETMRTVQGAFTEGSRVDVSESHVVLKNPETGEPEDRYFSYVLQPFLGRDGQVEGLMNVAHEVTSEVVSRKAIQQSEHQLRVFANSIHQLAWVARPDGHIYWYNDRWYQYTGTTPEEMEGWGWQSVHDPAELPRVIDQWKKSLSTGKAFEMEFPIRGSDGKFRWFLTRANPYAYESGKVLRWFGTNTDIDEQRRIRDELRAALAARDEFLSIASHELKTPLTSLKLQFQMGQRNLLPPKNKIPTKEELLATFDLGVRQINSLTELVEDLLDTSRIRTGNFTLATEDVNLSELVDETVSRVSEQMKAAGNLIESKTDDSIVGRWDRRRLQQVILNLLSNAVKYAPRSPVRISTERRGDNAVLIVQDFGPGIPKSMQEKVFDRFERGGAKKDLGGLGLGLFIVRTIVEAHHGNIQLESDEGKGAKFVVELPLSSETKGEEKHDAT